MQSKLLTDTEACIHLGITKELLYAYVRNAPKKHLGHSRKLASEFVEGKNMFDQNELESFDSYLKEPWSETGDNRPAIPKYIKEFLKIEIGGKCPITQKGYPLEDAHIVDYSISRSHHHHNIIRIARDEHTKFDNEIISKELLCAKKKELIEATRASLLDEPKRTKIITYLPNVEVSKLLCRDDELVEIRNSIRKNGRATIVNGVGGIGKTAIAQIYAQQYYAEYDNFIWLDFSDVTTSDNSEISFISTFTNNLLLLEYLNIQIDEKINIHQRFEIIINRLRSLSGKTLMILDNVPTEFGTFSLKLPNSEKLHILGTSRKIIEGFPTIRIDVLDEYSIVKLFYSFYFIETDESLLIKILDLFGRHTLTTELLSKLANKRGIKLSM